MRRGTGWTVPDRHRTHSAADPLRHPSAPINCSRGVLSGDKVGYICNEVSRGVVG